MRYIGMINFASRSASTWRSCKQKYSGNFFTRSAKRPAFLRHAVRLSVDMSGHRMRSR